ncbi:IS element transposase (plasmid) [Burkholderia gladioli BSR3]|uniref:IS element transposase n=1 Tax=Burkholderia gladioli (strain BSR3) TaxID=999541 RepID=F2LTC5_BURGS|nr:IS element transposase [Burkholderia gladioli BSR3]
MKPKSLHHGHRFPAAIISQAVRWYFRFQLSLRDIEELLFKRGMIVSYETIRRWCDKFGATFARRVKAARRKPGRIWHLDEMFVNLRGEPWLLRRAVDEHGAELDILLQKQRDKAAAKRFFQRVLRSFPAPRKIVTDQLRSYPAAKAGIPALADVKHVFVKAAARVNHRAENSHQPTHERDSAGQTHRRAAAVYCPRHPHPIASRISAINNLRYDAARPLTLDRFPAQEHLILIADTHPAGALLVLALVALIGAARPRNWRADA